MNNILNEQIKNLRILFFLYLENRILRYKEIRWNNNFFKLFENEKYNSFSKKLNEYMNEHERKIMFEIIDLFYIDDWLKKTTTIHTNKSFWTFTLNTKLLPTFVDISIKTAFNTIKNYQNNEIHFSFYSFRNHDVWYYEKFLRYIKETYFFKNKRSKYNKLLTKYWFLLLSIYFDLKEDYEYKYLSKKPVLYCSYNELNHIEIYNKIYNDLLEKFWEDYIKQWKIIYDNLTKYYSNLQYL